MENDFEEQMENLKTPDSDFIKHQDVFKIGFMNARKSSRIGIIFIIVPAVILLVAYIKLRFLMSIDFGTTFKSITNKAEGTEYMVWLIPTAFLVLPLLAAVVNLLAISHFYINKKTKELIITIQYRIVNIIVLLVSLLIIIIFWIVIILGYIQFK